MKQTRFDGPTVRLPICLMTGPAFSEAGLAGVGLYLNLLMWSRTHEEDGWVPCIIAEHFAKGARLSPKKRKTALAALVASGLLLEDGQDFVIAHYERFADTKTALAKQTARAKKRVKAARLRPTIIQRDGLRCHICGGDVLPRDVHVDHVHPLARGGESDPHNLRVSHSRCNLLKGAS